MGMLRAGVACYFVAVVSAEMVNPGSSVVYRSAVTNAATSTAGVVSETVTQASPEVATAFQSMMAMVPQAASSLAPAAGTPGAPAPTTPTTAPRGGEQVVR